MCTAMEFNTILVEVTKLETVDLPGTNPCCSNITTELLALSKICIQTRFPALYVGLIKDDF